MPVPFHFDYAENGTPERYNELVISRNFSKNGTFSGKVERIWNAPGTKTEWNDKHKQLVVYQHFSSQKWNAKRNEMERMERFILQLSPTIT